MTARGFAAGAALIAWAGAATAQTVLYPPGMTTPPAPAPSVPAAPAPPPAPAAPSGPASPDWLPRNTAQLQALDKVDNRETTLTVQVGQSVQFGRLTIAVRACDVRPPDQPQDAAAYLDITDPSPGAPAFHGWMLAAEPSVSMLEHPIYDVRVLGCR